MLLRDSGLIMRAIILLLLAILLLVPSLHPSLAAPAPCTKLGPSPVKILISTSKTCYAQGARDGSAAADKLIDQCKKTNVIPPHNNYTKTLTGKYKAEYIEGYTNGWTDENSKSLIDHVKYGFVKICHD